MAGVMAACKDFATEAANMTDLPRYVYVQVEDEDAEVHVSVLTYSSVAAGNLDDFTITIGGVSQTFTGRTGIDHTQVLTWGATSADVSEYQTGVPYVAGFTMVIRGLPKGFSMLWFTYPHLMLTNEVAGYKVTLHAPTRKHAIHDLSDEKIREYIKDADMGDYVRQFMKMREIVQPEVNENQYLKSYHKYVFGEQPAYLVQASLTPSQLQRLKSRLLCPDTWAAFTNLRGFLKKFYQDAWMLYALIQSENVFE
jgi:hypothetical protein